LAAAAHAVLHAAAGPKRRLAQGVCNTVGDGARAHARALRCAFSRARTAESGGGGSLFWALIFVCLQWKKKGKCRKGDKCAYAHPETRADAAGALGSGKRRRIDGTALIFAKKSLKAAQEQQAAALLLE
jgi:hypothetical protein